MCVWKCLRLFVCHCHFLFFISLSLWSTGDSLRTGQDQWWQFLSCPQGKYNKLAASRSSSCSFASLCCLLVSRFDVSTVNFIAVFLLSCGISLDFCYQFYFPCICGVFSWPCSIFCLLLNEGPSALHRQVTVTVHVDGASVRRVGLGSCASSPGLVIWAMPRARSFVRPLMELYAVEKVSKSFFCLGKSFIKVNIWISKRKSTFSGLTVVLCLVVSVSTCISNIWHKVIR